MTRDEKYMHRCLELAKRGAGRVAPNPMVGALLVEGDRIIAEGWHRQYGEAHAEVNCLNGVVADNLIRNSTLYVSLEPCAHFGKTPPCTDLIIKKGIPKVVIGCRDPFKEVNGRGVEKLKAAGIEVEEGILETECREINERFFVFHTKHRPYVLLKWAETADGFMAPLFTEGGEFISGNKRMLISNEYSNRLVHRWRSEEAAILVGTHTALYDDPELTTRLWPGPSPVRLVVDMDLRLPTSLKLFKPEVSTIVFNSRKHAMEQYDSFHPGKAGVGYYEITEDVSLVHQIMNALYQLNIQSVLVEGGARLLQSFIDEELWDEARVLTSESKAGIGLPAPELTGAIQDDGIQMGSDSIEYYRKNP